MNTLLWTLYVLGGLYVVGVLFFLAYVKIRLVDSLRFPWLILEAWLDSRRRSKYNRGRWQ